MVNEKGNCYKVFQSTLLQEERLLSRLSSTTLIKISIHAPTRGATLLLLRTAPLHGISIHAPTRGATSANMASTSSSLFQSTLLQEERLGMCDKFEKRGNFNPRSYKRSDQGDRTKVSGFNNFNPRSYKRSDHGRLK